MESITITRLQITDFQGIEELSIEPGQAGTLFSGPNGAGKTSALEAIEEALAAKGHRTRLVRGDADRAELLLTLSNGLTVRRVVKPDNSSTATIKDSEGRTLPKPQSVLDELGDPLRFRPVEFIGLTAKKQAEMLLAMVPMELSDEDLAALTPPWSAEPLTGLNRGIHPLELLSALEKSYSEERRIVGQEVKRLKGVVEGYAARVPEGFDAEVVRGTDLTAKVTALADARKHNEALVENDAALQRHQTAAQALRDKIADLQADLAIQEGNISTCAMIRDQSDSIDASALESDIVSYQEQRNALDAFDAKVVTKNELDVNEGRYEAWGTYIDAVRAKPQELFASAKPPVEGLGIDAEGNVTVNGLPLDNLSGGECIALAMQVAAATAGDLKVMLVNGIEALDETRREACLQQAQALGFQTFATVVHAGDGLTVDAL